MQFLEEHRTMGKIIHVLLMLWRSQMALAVISWMGRQKCRQQKRKVDKWDYIELKSFCAAKGTIHRMERKPTEWGEIPASHDSDNGSVPKIHIWNSYNSVAKKNFFNGQNTWIDTSPKTTSQRPMVHEKRLDIANHQGNASPTSPSWPATLVEARTSSILWLLCT